MERNSQDSLTIVVIKRPKGQVLRLVFYECFSQGIIEGLVILFTIEALTFKSRLEALLSNYVLIKKGRKTINTPSKSAEIVLGANSFS
jgi:hypothetical protein